MNLNARRICHERKRRAWTQAQLAGAAGLGLRTIQRVENTGVASFESVQAIAAALSLTVAELRVEGDFGGVRRAPGTGRCIERDGADPAGGQRLAWLSSLPLRLLIAALSGAATGLYVDQLLNDWRLSAVETFAFYAVPGLLSPQRYSVHIWSSAAVSRGEQSA
jgi:transcriptional regulator with XRE-family HTH domain